MRRLVIALLALAAACGSTEPHTAASIAGTWNSSDQLGAWRDVQLQLTETNSTTADGGWVATSTSTGTDVTGLATASIDGNDIVVTFSTNFAGQMSLQRVSDTRLQGTATFGYGSNFPPGPFPVTFDKVPNAP